MTTSKGTLRVTWSLPAAVMSGIWIQCQVGQHTKWLSVSSADASKPVSTLVDTINYEFGTTVTSLYLDGAVLSNTDIILHVLHDGDVVQSVGMLCSPPSPRGRADRGAPGSPLVAGDMWPKSSYDSKNGRMSDDLEHSMLCDSVKFTMAEELAPRKASLQGRRLSEMPWRERQPASSAMRGGAGGAGGAGESSTESGHGNDSNASEAGEQRRARTRWEVLPGTGTRWSDGQLLPPPRSSGASHEKIVLSRSSGVFVLPGRPSSASSCRDSVTMALAGGRGVSPQPLVGWAPGVI